MRIFKAIFLKIVNFFPTYIKWRIYFLPIFSQRLRIDFNASRMEILNRSSRILVIGANDGISFDNLINIIHPQKTEGVFVEPSKRYFNQLKDNLKYFPKLILLNIAVCKTNSNILLYQLNEAGLRKMPDWGRGIGSFSKDHLLKFDLVTDLDLEEEIVEGRTFSWLSANYNLHKIDYLQIDTEGYDAEIIKMIDFDNFYSKIIKFEITNLSEDEISQVLSIIEGRKYFVQRINSDMIAYSKDVNPIFY